MTEKMFLLIQTVSTKLFHTTTNQFGEVCTETNVGSRDICCYALCCCSLLLTVAWVF